MACHGAATVAYGDTRQVDELVPGAARDRACLLDWLATHIAAQITADRLVLRMPELHPSAFL